MNGTPQRLDVAYRLEWDGDWHVGSGEGSAVVDRLVRRRPRPRRGGPFVPGSQLKDDDDAKLPFVPGSQLKGVLRHQCERLAALLGVSVVPPHALEERPRELLEHFGPLAQSALLIDRLFGSRFEGGCLFVEDAVPETEDHMPWTAREQARTSIDRVSGTAREHTLFVTEVVHGQGRVLTSCIQARHPIGALSQYEKQFPFEYTLLLAGLLWFDALGGSKSIGLGNCHVTITRLRWNGDELALAEALKNLDEWEWPEMLTLLRGEQA